MGIMKKKQHLSQLLRPVEDAKNTLIVSPAKK